MKKIVALGEAVIDMCPSDVGCGIKDVKSFSPNIGGAPANLCGAIAKLGGDGLVITQLGDDPFGDKIEEYLKKNNVNTAGVCRTREANTGLSFVSLEADGNREFSFYRKPCADMLLAPEQLKEEWFKGAYAFHYCSLDLVDAPVRQAHLRAIEMAQQAGAIISFDPNLRFALWEDLDEFKKIVRTFIKYADLIKISDEELDFITEEKEEEAAWKWLQETYPKLQLLVYTKGSGGVSVWSRNGCHVEVDGKKVHAVDTTGAGDGCIGSFLYQMAEHEIGLEEMADITEAQLFEMASYANEYAAISVTGYGAIASYPTGKEMEELMNK